MTLIAIKIDAFQIWLSSMLFKKPFFFLFPDDLSIKLVFVRRENITAVTFYFAVEKGFDDNSSKL